jgi:hypothetical protein
LSHPVPARLVDSQSASHEGSSKLPPGSRSPAQSTSHEGRSKLPPGSPSSGLCEEKKCETSGLQGGKSVGHVVTTPFSGLPPTEEISRLTTESQRHTHTSQQPFLPGIGSLETSEPPSLQGSSTFNPFPSHHPGGYTELGTPSRERRQPGLTPPEATLLCPLPRVRIPARHRSCQAASRRPPAVSPMERCPKPRGLLPP